MMFTAAGDAPPGRLYNSAAKQRLAQRSCAQGYGAFTVSRSDLNQVYRYIARQEEHHKHVSFKDELLRLLREHGIDLDERYFWD